MRMKTYTINQTEIHDKFVGLWKDQHGNLVVVRAGTHGDFLASFALGATHAPFIRRCFRNALTVDMPGEFRPAWEAVAIEFGLPYRGPDLLLTYCIDEETHQEYLEPSYVIIESATNEERECYNHITTVDNLSRVAQADWDECLTTYHLNNQTLQKNSY
jgi:hypothetical protein